MRISDWSSDVCSSDLNEQRARNLLSECDRVGHLRAAPGEQYPVARPRVAKRPVRVARMNHDQALRHRHIGEGVEGVAFGIEQFAVVQPDHKIERVERHDASFPVRARNAERSEEHTSELQSLMRISYAVFC